jgi:hypothetical protein
MKKKIIVLYEFITFVTTFTVSILCMLLTIDYAMTDALECYPHTTQFKIFCVLVIGMWGLPMLLLSALQSLDKKGKKS